MEWYCYLSGFWSGMFLANFVPHFIKGISGDKFPTPFSKPRGKGLSSPTVNVVWALFNLLIGILLFKSAKISFESNGSMLVFFIGIACMSIPLSRHFANKEKENN